MLGVTAQPQQERETAVNATLSCSGALAQSLPAAARLAGFRQELYWCLGPLVVGAAAARGPPALPAPQGPGQPEAMTPGRVRAGFRGARQAAGTPASAAKTTRPGPGRPQGSKNKHSERTRSMDMDNSGSRPEGDVLGTDHRSPAPFQATVSRRRFLQVGGVLAGAAAVGAGARQLVALPAGAGRRRRRGRSLTSSTS